MIFNFFLPMTDSRIPRKHLRYLPPEFSERNPANGTSSVFRGRVSAPIIFSVGIASITINYWLIEALPRGGILGLDPRETSKRVWSRVDLLHCLQTTPFRPNRIDDLVPSPPSTLFRARKPPPAGAATCRGVFTLKQRRIARSSMRRWKWVIRSLTEIFGQNFAPVP